MRGDLTIKSGDVRLQVSGLTKLLRDLNRAGADSQDMSQLMHELGMIVVRDARTRTPRESGKLVKTLRAGRGKTKAVVRAGSRAVPYAGIVHYGTPAASARQFAPNHFLLKSLQATQSQVYRALLDGLDAILAKNNLT